MDIPRTNFEIYLIGTGATGSQLLPFLCQLLNNFTEYNKHKLVIMDGDYFEKKNIKNQKCTLEHVGHSKAKVLCNRYQQVYPNIDIGYIDEYVTDANSLIKYLKTPKGIIETTKILVSCVDNEPTRKILHNVFYNKDIDRLIYIDSGNGTIERVGQIVVGYKEIISKNNINLSFTENIFNTSRWEDISEQKVILKPVGDIFPQILQTNDDVSKHVGCGAIVDRYPQNIATNVMASSCLFSILNEIISEYKIHNHIVYFDAENTSIINRKVNDDVS